VTRRRYQKKIDSLASQVRDHREKIEAEKARLQPDEGLIAHWEREVRAFESAIKRILRRRGKS